jgi:hypothetical protein
MSTRALRVFVVVLSGAVLAGGALAVAAAAKARAKPQLSERRILRIALKFAARSGDRTPILIQHAAGTSYRANIVASGDGTVGNQWSYLIAERGHFVLNYVSVPPGTRFPRGTVLTLVLTARTGHLTALGVSDHYPDLAKLGPVHTDWPKSPVATSRRTR